MSAILLTTLLQHDRPRKKEKKRKERRGKERKGAGHKRFDDEQIYAQGRSIDNQVKVGQNKQNLYGGQMRGSPSCRVCNLSPQNADLIAPSTMPGR